MPSLLKKLATVVSEAREEAGCVFLHYETIESLLAAIEAARELIDSMGVELDDERMSYLVCQVYRGDLQDWRAALAKLDEVQP